MRQPVPFGKYVLLERISVGGMAEVFKAKSFGVEGFEKILAIKRILPSLAEDSDFIEMFIDEAKICGQLNHANICQIFELGRVQDSHFIAMEYVWGKDLLQIQNRYRKVRQTMKPEMAAFVAAKLCEGLDYAHKKKDATGRPLGIIHRDISPQNILISYEGELKIIDFGIAKAASRSSKTQAGVLKGKFGYMSPEQVRGLPLDRRSDVFAIGTILYELLTADRVFLGESDFETLEKVRNVDVPPPSKVNPQVPAALEKIILRALKKDVEDRYQWASEMQEELQSFLMGREPVFTAKQLSGWMREQFAVEMKREQEILDEQRRVGKEVLTAQVAQSFGAAVSMVSASATPMPAPLGDLPSGATRVVDDADLMDVSDDEEEEDDDGEFGERTTVSTPSFGAAPQAAPEPSSLPEQKTQILGDGAALAAPGRASNGAGSLDELPAQPTVILGDGMAPPQPVGPLRAGPQAATLLAQPAPVLPPRPATYPQGGAHLTPGTGTVGPLPYAPRSTLWKDILIGVGVAALLVLGVLGVRALVQNGPKAGTLVVMAQPPSAAEVLIDGKVRGQLRAGKPLTLKHVEAGAHAVVVRAADGSEFRQTLTLAAGDVSVLAAALKQPGLGSGTLKLNVRTDGARVYVDGAELTDGAWKSPIPLRADLPHEIRVDKPGREEVKLTVLLKAGEVQQKDIELLPAYGKIAVSSDPPGVEVNVNGHHAGITPLTVADVDPGKPARVTLRHHGYAELVKYVSFDQGLTQTLDIKMVASNDEGSSAGASSRPTELGGGGGGKGAMLAEIKLPDPERTHGREHHGHSKPQEITGDDLAPIKVGPAEHEVKEAAHAASGPGFLVANTQPWARVLIDGHDTGKTTPIAPRSKIALKPGKHTVTFLVSGKRFNFGIDIKSGEDTRLIKQLSDTP